jgi:hypothetical protein
MHSTLTAKPSDDPHDFVVVPPDAVRVAPSDDEISDLLQQAARHRSDTQTRADASDFAAGAMVPEVDTTSFRAASVNDVPVPGEHRSMARRALRGIIALLLAACFGAAAIAWKGYGDVAIKQIAKLTTQIVLISSLTSEKPALAEQPEPAAVPADAANNVSPQPAPAAQTAAEAAAPAAAAPSADQAQLLQSMTRDLASVRQEVEQLKAGIAELKASQPQVSRDVAKASEVKASEPNLRPRISAAPPRPAAVRARKPMPSYPQPQALAAPVRSTAAASYVPPTTAPYVPRQAEPQPPTTGEVLTDPELTAVPRPPMPLR